MKFLQIPKRLYVIEEWHCISKKKSLCHAPGAMSYIYMSDKRKEAEDWMDTLDKARGQQANDDFIRNKFKIITYELRKL